MASTTSTGARMPTRARTLRLVRGRLNCWSELEVEEKNPGRMDGWKSATRLRLWSAVDAPTCDQWGAGG